MFSDIDDTIIKGTQGQERLLFETIDDGGAAMTAYSYLQFVNIDPILKKI